MEKHLKQVDVWVSSLENKIGIIGISGVGRWNLKNHRSGQCTKGTFLEVFRQSFKDKRKRSALYFNSKGLPITVYKEIILPSCLSSSPHHHHLHHGSTLVNTLLCPRSYARFFILITYPKLHSNSSGSVLFLFRVDETKVQKD